jgi:hypothetical protein
MTDGDYVRRHEHPVTVAGLAVPRLHPIEEIIFMRERDISLSAHPRRGGINE